jgi:hypothetical protein
MENGQMMKREGEWDGDVLLDGLVDGDGLRV